MAHVAFDRYALQQALDDKRQLDGLSWASVRREINERFKDVPGHKPIAVSTIFGLGVEADGILQLLLWLRRSPESFVPNFEGADAECYRLPELDSTQILRVDSKSMFAALDLKRITSGLSWRDIDREFRIGSTSPLLSLAKGGRTTITMLTLVAVWLGKPSATFTRASAW
jgi:hypothetical protein